MINPSIILQNGVGFIFKWIFHYSWGKFSDLQCSDYWKMPLWNSPSLSMMSSLVPHVEQPSHNLLKKVCPHEKRFLEKVPQYLGEGGDTIRNINPFIKSNTKKRPKIISRRLIRDRPQILLLMFKWIIELCISPKSPETLCFFWCLQEEAKKVINLF